MEGTAAMKAIIQERYGSPDLLKLMDIPTPEIGDDQVLVRVHAASLNSGDWRRVRGAPFLVRMFNGWLSPKNHGVATDAAGIAEAVGKDVTHVQVGDSVYGVRLGACGEYVSGKNFVAMPANLTFEEAASIPVTGCTALQAVRDHAQLVGGRAGAHQRGGWRRGDGPRPDRKGVRRPRDRGQRYRQAGHAPRHRRGRATTDGEPRALSGWSETARAAAPRCQIARTLWQFLSDGSLLLCTSHDTSLPGESLSAQFVADLWAKEPRGDAALYLRTVGYAWRWTATMTWSDSAVTRVLLDQTNALVDSTEAEGAGLRLDMP